LFSKPRPELSQTLLVNAMIDPSDNINDVKKACKLIGILACSPSFQTEVILPAVLNS